ncbi:Tat pathway signal sequence domain protein [Sphingomonas psychrotolerans]|uniref:Tat pathway signal sequence domain protein n=1 Tax=Sphingomonas psychrotolerans TaxID=1327635 RepID=A0ABU3N4M3_9SPHN|nr:Tat pathway signal sequence domain protein [Sphingomonas psychrotolerans]MDT8758814.1 Tat pathway signal sequence domain protein [Sphingomonas psychrotolerans]
MRLTRRTMMQGTILSAAVAGAAPAIAQSRRSKGVEAPVRWIDGAAPELHLGQTFGVAWARGTLTRGRALTVQTASGEAVPSQSWPTAFWPDGSIKWTAHALPAGVASDKFVVASGRSTLPAAPVSVRETGDAILIRSGPLEWEIGKSGPAAIRSAKQGDRTLIANTRLLGELRAGSPEGERVALTGTVERAVIEQKGPVRAVIRLEGHHVGGGRAVLPFVVRLYAYAGSDALRIVHSFILDIEATDHVSALGIAADVPMRAPLHDRHVRLATADDAMFAEAVRPLTGLRRDPGKSVREAQVAGRTVPTAEMRAPVGKLLERIPAWSDFSLSQLSANGFTLTKRTAEDHSWIDADEGRRAPGFGYVGSPQGGAGIAARYFCQRHPTQIDIRNAASDTARLTAWLWSPDARPMDLRPWRGTMGMEGYAAQNEGLDITYEDYEPGWDDPTGIARTSELMLWAFDATPETPRLQALARGAATPPQLMAEPAHLHAAGVFGDWGLPDRSTPKRALIEDQLANLVDFYVGEVDRRSWYGFWDHGDVMHSYDTDRHQWKYDIGGFAWDNSELSTDLWLWYAALRSGDAKTWRLAEAMTRHTGEVDVYHIGRFAGLGTRHGVQHWSDSSKQPRVSNAAYRRIFYYLTADERVGDLMRALATSEQTLAGVEIGRKTGAPKEDLPEGVIQMAFGTTWAVCAGAWLTEWERTGDRKWRDRIVAGMDSIGRMPNGWLTGGAPYDLKSGRFLVRDNIGISHLNSVFGAVEIQAELIELIDVPRFRTAWLDYCRWYNAPRAEWAAKFSQPYGGRNLKQGHSRLTAYVAEATGDAALARRAAEEFYSGEAGMRLLAGDPRVTLPGGVVEWPGVSTNGAAQFGLAAIQDLALVPEALDTVPIPTRAPRTDQANPEQAPGYRP